MRADAVVAALAADPKALGDLRRRAAGGDKSALLEAARQFETMLLDMTMKSMRATVPADGPINGEGTRMFTELLDQQFVQGVSRRGGLGLAEVLVRQLSQARESRVQETRNPADKKAGEAR